jgi:outer membrane biosynthesis protein TonB
MPALTLPTRSSPLTRAFAWSLVLHAALVVVAALPVVREAVATWQEAALRRAAMPAPAAVPLEVEVVVPEVVAVRPPPAPAESFIRTDGLPEAAPEPGKARFISDRDTRAASPLPADPAATEDQPTQEGIDVPVVEVIRKEQSDGEDETLPPSPAVMAAGAASAAASADAPATEVAAEPPVEAETTPPEPRPDPAPAAALAEVTPPAPPPPDEMPAPVEERLALARESDVSVTDDRVKPRPQPQPRPTKDVTRPAARLRDPEVASRPPEPPRPEPAQRPAAATPPAGFSGLRMPTRLRGTISNQGPASVDAEDTPTGRYMKQVTSAIEKEWHRKRRMNRDFVTFGTIKLEFFVNARGEVQNLTIKNRSGANAVMQDFTLNAVLDAAIPPMPEGLTEILDREQLLISYDIIVY